MTSGKRILWTIPYLPWPTTSGGKLRQFQLLRAMAARGHRIALLVQSKAPLTPEAERALREVVDELHVLPRRPLAHPVTLGATLFSGAPLLACVNGYAAALERRFGELLDRGWDVVQIEHSYGCQPFLKALAARRVPFVLTEHNVESTLSAATYNKLPSWLRPLARVDQARYRRWERRVFDAAARVLTVTEEDKAVIQTLTRTPVRVVVNGVDDRAFAAVEPDPGARRVLFIGNYEYAPNVDAVEWLLRDIMPQVWALEPVAVVAVCGYAMPERWRREFTDSRIEWRGFVDDLRAVQRQSSVFVAPLRDGGGSKLKVLEALAAGLPLASTPEGVSGLRVSHGREALIADDAGAFARHVAELLAAPEAARAMAAAGRAYVTDYHAWSRVARDLEAVHDEIAAHARAAA